MFIKIEFDGLYALALPNTNSNGKLELLPNISSYKILFSLETTTIESIDRFMKATYPIVLERDKFFKLSLKEYLALSFKLIEKGIIFDKRKNCFRKCSS